MSESLKAGAYVLRNRMAPFVLFLSEDDQRSVIAEFGGPEDNQTWSIELVGGGRVRIMSKANGLFLGFPGMMPMPGMRLIVGEEDIAKDWEVIRDQLGFKFKLPDTPFVIEFPSNNLRPGAPAQLGMIFSETDNQVWSVERREPELDSASDSD